MAVNMACRQLSGQMTMVLPMEKEVPITLTAGQTVLSATLQDSPTARDFLARLPMTIKMGRWFHREYAGVLAGPLIRSGEHIPDFSNGDIAYYPSGHSLAIYFAGEGASHPPGLIRIGKITSDLALFDNLGQLVHMRIDRVL